MEGEGGGFRECGGEATPDAGRMLGPLSAAPCLAERERRSVPTPKEGGGAGSEGARRARGGAEALDLLLEEGHERRGVEQRLGLLEQERLVRAAAALHTQTRRAR